MNLYFKPISFLFINLFTTIAFAQNYAIENLPKELKSRATAIVRDENIVLDMKNEANLTQTTSRAITILNQSGQDHAEIMLYYDKSKVIKDIKGHILDEFGNQIAKFSQKDFKDYSASGSANMYDDVRVKHYEPTVSNYPYTIVYSYEMKHNQNLFIPYWRPNYSSDLAVEKSSYQLSCKPDLVLRIKTENFPSKVKEEVNEKFKTYTWSVSNINASKQEPYSPIKNSKDIVVKIVPENFQYFKKQGQVKDWNDFGKWVYDALLKDKQDLPQTAKDKVKELTAQLTDPREKAKVLYQYLQSKTRYISIQVGIGGLEPFPASYVDRLGYGDCKALVNYMQALLAEANIPSLYCIVEAGNRKISLDETFANAVDGNHIILAIPHQNDTTWLECTSSRHPFGFLGDFTDDRLVLACTAEGGKVLRTHSFKHNESTQIRKGKFNIDGNGNIKGNMSTNFAGNQFENHFSNTFNNPNDQNKELIKMYNVDNISFDKFEYKIQTDSTATLTENLDLNIKSYVVKNGNQFILSPNLFNISQSALEVKNRSNEVYINRGYKDIDTFEFTFENKLKGTIIPVSQKFDSPMGKYELSIHSEGQKIFFKRSLEIIDGTYPAEDYQKYYDFMQKVSSNDRIKYTINTL